MSVGCDVRMCHSMTLCMPHSIHKLLLTTMADVNPPTSNPSSIISCAWLMICVARAYRAVILLHSQATPAPLLGHNGCVDQMWPHVCVDTPMTWKWSWWVCLWPESGAGWQAPIWAGTGLSSNAQSGTGHYNLQGSNCRGIRGVAGMHVVTPTIRPK